MFYIGEKVLRNKIKSLSEDVLYLKREIVRLEDVEATEDIREAKNALSYKLGVMGLENEIHELKTTLNDRVNREVATQKKDLKAKAESQEREHKALVKKLEADYVEKLARVDRKLEEDKTSFRKYLKTEFNTKVESLEKENERLLKESITARAEQSAATDEAENYLGQIDSLTSIMCKLVEALPKVSSHQTSPENHFHVEVPGAKGGNQGGGNKENKN